MMEGICYRKKGMLEKAEEVLEKGLEMDLKDRVFMEYVVLLGKICMKMKKYDKAIEHYQKAS